MYNKYRGLFGNNNLQLPASDVKPVAELAPRISLSLFHTHVRCPCPFTYMQNDSSRMSHSAVTWIYSEYEYKYVLISLSCMSRSSLLTPPLSFPRDSRVSLDLFFFSFKMSRLPFSVCNVMRREIAAAMFIRARGGEISSVSRGCLSFGTNDYINDT